MGGHDARLKVEDRMRELEGRPKEAPTAAASKPQLQQPVVKMSVDADVSRGYNVAADSTLTTTTPAVKEKGSKKKKKEAQETTEGEVDEKKKKKRAADEGDSGTA